jgi:hypothetical protein
MLHLSHSQRLKCAVLWQSREGVPSQGQIPDTFLSPESPNGVGFDTFFFFFLLLGGRISQTRLQRKPFASLPSLRLDYILLKCLFEYLCTLGIPKNLSESKN